MKRARAVRILGGLALLFCAALIAAIVDHWIDPPTPIAANGQLIVVADGDSFAIGTTRIRLDGIDSPEYRQSCLNPAGIEWACGNAARDSLEQMLRHPGLSCLISATDQYGRAIARCTTSADADVAAAQVAAGWAVSNEYFGLRDYGDEEDGAKVQRKGMWAGSFIPPAEWRELAK